MEKLKLVLSDNKGLSMAFSSALLGSIVAGYYYVKRFNNSNAFQKVPLLKWHYDAHFAT